MKCLLCNEIQRKQHNKDNVFGKEQNKQTKNNKDSTLGSELSSKANLTTKKEMDGVRTVYLNKKKVNMQTLLLLQSFDQKRESLYAETEDDRESSCLGSCLHPQPVSVCPQGHVIGAEQLFGLL